MPSFPAANADKASRELRKAGHQVQETADNAAKKTSGFFSRKSHEVAEAVPSLKVRLPPEASGNRLHSLCLTRAHPIWLLNLILGLELPQEQPGILM